jgi:hypothetical protein
VTLRWLQVQLIVLGSLAFDSLVSAWRFRTWDWNTLEPDLDSEHWSTSPAYIGFLAFEKSQDNHHKFKMDEAGAFLRQGPEIRTS